MNHHLNMPRMACRSRNQMSGFCAASLLMSSFFISGCVGKEPQAVASMESLGNAPLQLTSELTHGGYMTTSASSSMLLSDVPIQVLQSGECQRAQVVHLQLLWKPRPGMTSVSANGTNVVIRYIIINEDEVGVYAGGGFAWPSGDIGSSPIRLNLIGSSLVLTDHTEGFIDIMSPAKLTGSFTAPFDPIFTLQMRQAVSQIVTNAVGSGRWVRAPEHDAFNLALLYPGQLREASDETSLIEQWD